MASEPDVGGLVADGVLGGYVPVLGGGELSRALTHVSRVSPRRCLAGLAASLWWSGGRVWRRAQAGRGRTVRSLSPIRRRAVGKGLPGRPDLLPARKGLHFVLLDGSG